ncbi:MAG: non-homologous end-joining DNA ligase, partial [Acetobacteraceae bacterium]
KERIERGNPPSTRTRRARGIRRIANDPLPDFIEPELATLVTKPPSGPDWIHEVKLDGYRMLCRIENGVRRFLTRRGHDWTTRISALVERIRLPVETAAIDGELVALDGRGFTNFGALQQALADDDADRMAFFAFDLLHLDGIDLRALPLIERKEKLRELLKRNTADGAPIFFSEHFQVEGDRFFGNACEMALEGVVSKRIGAPYRSGRSPNWMKTKCRQRQEFAIGGFTERASGPGQVGAVLLGYYDGDRLAYAGKVGAALGASEMSRLRKHLDGLRAVRSPFAVKVPATRDTIWVRPEAVCEVDFHNWTSDGRLRQGRFEGLRLDKGARDVMRERPGPSAKIVGRTASDGRRPHGIPRSKESSIGSRNKSGVEAPDVRSPLRLTHPDRVLFAA